MITTIRINLRGALAALVAGVSLMAMGILIVCWRPAMPDPDITPGHVVSSDPQAVCGRAERAQVSEERRAAVRALYGLSAAQAARRQISHLIPVSWGGSDDVRNLWPQPAAEAAARDRLARIGPALFCARGGQAPTYALIDMQHEIAQDWRRAYGRYVGRMP